MTDVAKRLGHPRLTIATGNLGKLAEFRDMLAQLDLPIDGLADHPQVTLPPEIGATYADNAVVKAETACRATGLPALGDDSGIEVAVLGGRPGLFSARFAKEREPNESQDAANRRYLLAELLKTGAPAKDWTARFKCALAFATPGQSTRLFFGEIPGIIVPEERGTGGFGYDPIVFLPAYQQTFAQLDDAEKNRISHRARAVASFLETILG